MLDTVYLAISWIRPHVGLWVASNRRVVELPNYRVLSHVNVKPVFRTPAAANPWANSEEKKKKKKNRGQKTEKQRLKQERLKKI